MTGFIIGIICFVAGSVFGIFIMSALALAKQADNEMEGEITGGD